MKVLPVLLGALLGLVSLALATTRDDPCDFATPNFASDQTKYYATPSEALACFRSIPFREDVRQNALKVVRYFLELYSYKELVKDSGPPYDLAIDWESELSTIGKNTYENDWDFQNDLRALFVKFQDKHTLYYPPKPYTTALSTRPFFLGLNNEGENTEVIISAVSSRYLKEGHLISPVDTDFDGGPLSALLGKPLLAIDGIPVLDYFLTHEDESLFTPVVKYLTFSKDPTTCLNSIIGLNGWRSFPIYIGVRRRVTETLRTCSQFSFFLQIRASSLLNQKHTLLRQMLE